MPGSLTLESAIKVSCGSPVSNASPDPHGPPMRPSSRRFDGAVAGVERTSASQRDGDSRSWIAALGCASTNVGRPADRPDNHPAGARGGRVVRSANCDAGADVTGLVLLFGCGKVVFIALSGIPAREGVCFSKKGPRAPGFGVLARNPERLGYRLKSYRRSSSLTQRAQRPQRMEPEGVLRS